MSEDTQPSVVLREVREDDLDIFFEQQLDPEATYMAAFTAKDPADRDAFNAHWFKILGDKSITIQTILYQGQVAGYILSHAWFGDPEVSYWLGKEFWGVGIATRALATFLETLDKRPLYARVAQDNVASIRVLEKCGFRITGKDKGFAIARGQEIEEYILTLLG
jgi:RimJ/RimL family protein N-acetyltransferase